MFTIAAALVQLVFGDQAIQVRVSGLVRDFTGNMTNKIEYGSFNHRYYILRTLHWKPGLSTLINTFIPCCTIVHGLTYITQDITVMVESLEELLKVEWMTSATLIGKAN